MRSILKDTSQRRAAYLRLSGLIEGLLREAYLRRHTEGRETQASLARKLGVGRSTVNKRLLGHSNLTIETIADLSWALEHQFEVRLRDMNPTQPTNSSSNSASAVVQANSLPTKSTAASLPITIELAP